MEIRLNDAYLGLEKAFIQVLAKVQEKVSWDKEKDAGIETINIIGDLTNGNRENFEIIYTLFFKWQEHFRRKCVNKLWEDVFKHNLKVDFGAGITTVYGTESVTFIFRGKNKDTEVEVMYVA